MRHVRSVPPKGAPPLNDSQHQDPGEGGAVEPLTHRNADGDVYQRTPAVERQIATALALPHDRLRQRLAVADQNATDYLKEECLVYLIRHYHRVGDAGLVNSVSEALLHRCARFIDGH